MAIVGVGRAIVATIGPDRAVISGIIVMVLVIVFYIIRRKFRRFG